MIKFPPLHCNFLIEYISIEKQHIEFNGYFFSEKTNEILNEQPTIIENDFCSEPLYIGPDKHEKFR